MRSLRALIARAMAVVAVVGLNGAAARVVFALDAELLIGVALPCIALQWAVFSVFRRRGRARAFWVGFTMFGSILTASFVWAMLFPDLLGFTGTGALVKTPGSPLYAIWMGYGRLVADRVGPILFDFSADPDPFGVALVTFRALIWSLPQMLTALVGGLVMWGISSVGGDKFRIGNLGDPLATSAGGLAPNPPQRETGFAS